MLAWAMIGTLSCGLTLICASEVAAQQPTYHIDSSFVGTWTPYLTKDTALAPVLTLRSNGRFTMRTTETHESFSGETRQRMVLTGEWRVRTTVYASQYTELCLQPDRADDMSCQSAFKKQVWLVLGSNDVWKPVDRTTVGSSAVPHGPTSGGSHGASRSSALRVPQVHTLDSSDSIEFEEYLLGAHPKPTGAGSGVERSFSDGQVPVNTNRTYMGYQVEKPALAKEDNPKPIYPSKLESAGVEGEVLVQFVIDTTGRADMSTFKVLKSSNDLFTISVKNVLPRMRFYPAETGGRKVKQFVHFPFSFAKPH